MNIKSEEIKLNLIMLFLLVSMLCFTQPCAGIFDPFDYGAKADGITLDTKAIQNAIDDCHENGGGKVYLHKGTFITGTIFLKNNVTLYIEVGATLKGSNNLEDFPVIPSRYPSYEGKYETNKMMIYAEDAVNISIVGNGLINGNGDYWVEGPYGTPSFSKRPRIIHFRNCENILIRDVTLYNSASWVQSYQSCKNIVIDGITVDSRENKDIDKERYADVPGRNTDGLDLIDCQKVRITNCYINSGDDAICLKSFSPDEGCRDITITNCVISSNASGIKIGTETAGAFEDIIIQNCVVYDTRNEPIAILTVDGARIERIIISNISMRNIKGPAIGIRLGTRNRTYRENANINEPALRDILIENIQGSGIVSDYGCVITGVKNRPIENIVMKNINLRFEGGGKIEDSYREIPENEGAYPSGRMFGRMPAYGFFLRHAKNVVISDIQIGFDEEDQRPAIVADNVEKLDIRNFKAEGTIETPELIRLINSREIVISNSKPTSEVPVFLTVVGRNTGNIILQNNLLNNSRQNINYKDGALKSSVREY